MANNYQLLNLSDFHFSHEGGCKMATESSLFLGCNSSCNISTVWQVLRSCDQMWFCLPFRTHTEMNPDLLYKVHYWNYSGEMVVYHIPQNILLKKVFSKSQYLSLLRFRANLQEMRLHFMPGVTNEQYFVANIL